ncbi:MAG: sigma-70 family RNA polymerase sigma factor [Rhodospirillaceae bacterium]|nr:sigma-70 family RNA polymerase sigma factor [Rhodospirillaceae bacterium]
MNRPAMDLGDDDALMSRAAAGDRRAFSMLVGRHGDRVRAIALRFTGSRADADDIAQAVFVSLWQAVPRWRPGAAQLSTWLYRVTVNRCIDASRRRRVRRWFGLDAVDDELMAEDVTADVAAEQASELAAVRQDILALPPRQRAAILLAADGERGTAEIGAALGVSEGAAEQLLVRARRSLRERMRSRLGDCTEAVAVGATPRRGRTG